MPVFSPYFLFLLRDFLTAEDKEGVFNADHFPLWYKRAAEQVPGTFVYSIPFASGTIRFGYHDTGFFMDESLVAGVTFTSGVLSFIDRMYLLMIGVSLSWQRQRTRVLFWPAPPSSCWMTESPPLLLVSL